MKPGRKRWLVVIAIVLVGIAFLFGGKEGRQRRVELRFCLAREKFEMAAQSMLETSSWKNFLGSGNVNVWDCQGRQGVRIVTFSMGAWGFGSETGYHGVYTTTDGQAAPFQGADHTLTAQGKGWIWEEPEGDNHYYTEEISSGWYYYAMTF